ncbi:unnamed protein product [Dovyalis caffra]|uniref:Uncharacterized protein n=1 Tax=Dovyalis caffra TaxID=77055 RepID=A0AAV1QRH4_9ROSI|nr:unnamed protein product [Dovyalis caffra]
MAKGYVGVVTVERERKKIEETVTPLCDNGLQRIQLRENERRSMALCGGGLWRIWPRRKMKEETCRGELSFGYNEG